MQRNNGNDQQKFRGNYNRYKQMLCWNNTREQNKLRKKGKGEVDPVPNHNAMKWNNIQAD
jgi:hypothetical protein